MYGQTLIGKVISNEQPQALAQELRRVQIIALNSRKLLEFAQKQSFIRLKITDEHDWLLELTSDPVFAADYALTVSTEKGLSQTLSSKVQTYKGRISGSANGKCRLTLAEGFIYGVFDVEGKSYFIEPARRFNHTFGEDQYLFYESADILPNPHGRCAGAVLSDQFKDLAGLEKSAGACYTVEVAIATDYKMLQLFNEDVNMLEKYVAAILNAVRSNYDEEFNYQIRFELVKLWASTCADCDPWGEDTNYENLLANFRDWGNANGFGKTFDVATLWTGRVLNDNIGGGGYYGVLCGRLRYNVLRRYSENAGLMRALQAHELGHNLNAQHDSTNSQTIMAPYIRDVNAWSPSSKVSINNYFHSVIGLPNCVAACQESTPSSDFFVQQSKGCAPLTVQFFNTSAASATQYEWTFEGGNPATSNAVNPLITFEKPGVYSVMLHSIGVGGEDTMTKTALIEVQGPPEPIFSIENQVGTTSATFSTAVEADSLRWWWGEDYTSQEASITLDFQVDGTYPVSLITYNKCGADTLTRQVNIVTLPQAGFSAANYIGCAPLTVHFNNESSPNAVEFAWQFNGGTPAISNEKNPTVVFEKPGVYSVSLLVRNAAGEVTKRLNNLIQVNGEPIAGFSMATNQNEVTFRNLTQNGAYFHWDFGDGTTTATVNPIHNYATSGIFQVQLIAENDCGSDTTFRTIEITGFAPQTAFNSNVQEGCVPMAVQFTDESTNEPESWQWHFPGGEPEFSTDQNPTVTYQQPGLYSIALVTSNFFGTDTLIRQDYVQILEKPSVDFNWNIQNQQVMFNLSDVVQRNWEYEWHFGDGNTSNQPAPEYTYANPGSYAVELLVSNACGKDTISKVVQISTTAIAEAHWLGVFELYPNPNTGGFYVSLKGEPQDRLLLRVFNTLGQEVHQQAVDFSTGNWQQYLDFQYLASGVYWLDMQSNTGMVKKAFILKR